MGDQQDSKEKKIKKEDEFMNIKDAGKIHFILENYKIKTKTTEKKRLFIKLKRIRRYELDELLNVSSPLDLPNEINNGNIDDVIKGIINTFKDNYLKNKSKDICIIFQKEDTNDDKKIEVDKGIIYYYRDNDRKIKIFSK